MGMNSPSRDALDGDWGSWRLSVAVTGGWESAGRQFMAGINWLESRWGVGSKWLAGLTVIPNWGRGGTHTPLEAHPCSPRRATSADAQCRV